MVDSCAPCRDTRGDSHLRENGFPKTQDKTVLSPLFVVIRLTLDIYVTTDVGHLGHNVQLRGPQLRSANQFRRDRTLSLIHSNPVDPSACAFDTAHHWVLLETTWRGGDAT